MLSYRISKDPQFSSCRVSADVASLSLHAHAASHRRSTDSFRAAGAHRRKIFAAYRKLQARLIFRRVILPLHSPPNLPSEQPWLPPTSFVVCRAVFCLCSVPNIQVSHLAILLFHAFGIPLTTILDSLAITNKHRTGGSTIWSLLPIRPSQRKQSKN